MIEFSILLGCDVVLLGKWFMTFQRSLSPLCASAFFMDHERLKVRVLHLFEMTGTTNPSTQSHIPEDGNPVLGTGFKLYLFLVETHSFRGQTE